MASGKEDMGACLRQRRVSEVFRDVRDVKGEAEDRSRRGKGIGDSLRRRARKVGWDGT